MGKRKSSHRKEVMDFEDVEKKLNYFRKSEKEREKK